MLTNEEMATPLSITCNRGIWTTITTCVVLTAKRSTDSDLKAQLEEIAQELVDKISDAILDLDSEQISEEEIRTSTTASFRTILGDNYQPETDLRS
jgi:hypothetical protein